MLDSHAHVISPEVARYPVIAEERVRLIANSFTVEELAEAMDRAHVFGGLLVNRGQFYGYDNSYVCDAASEAPHRFRAVCGIDLQQSNCGTTAQDWLLRGAAGFRLMQAFSAAQDVSWLGGEFGEAVWSISSDAGLPLCVHFFPGNRSAGLVELARLMDLYPNVRVVIDHLSNCPVSASGALLVDDAFRAIADRANAYVKLTTIPLGRYAAEGLSMDVLMQSAVALFGAGRLMWGSDITQSSGDYDEMVGYAHQATASLAESDRAAVLSENAARLYQMSLPVQEAV